VRPLKEHILRTAYGTASKLLYGNSVHADWAWEKMQRFSSCLTLAGNLACFYLRRPRIYRLISLVVEPVFGCNLKCKTCWGTLDLAGRRPHLMTWDVFRKAVDQTPAYVETITFSLLGETLLHPRLHEMIDYTAEHGKRAILFTNGTLLDGERLDRLARSKLAVLNVSVEVDDEAAREIRGTDQRLIRRNVEAFLAVKAPQTEVKLSLVAHAGNVQRLDHVWDYWGDLVEHIKVSPMTSYSGQGPPSLCMEPWRGNLNVFTSGQVSPCCVDCWPSLVIGNLNVQSLDEIIRGRPYRDLLTRFLAGEAPPTCGRCTEFSDPRIPLRMPRQAVARRP